MTEKNVTLRIGDHEVRLLTAGMLIALAVKSKTIKGRIFLGTVGIIMALGDVVLVSSDAKERWMKSFDEKLTVWMEKHLYGEPKPDTDNS